MDYQNMDFTDTIARSYVSLLTNADIMNEVAEKFGTQSRYLKEILSIYVSNRILTVKVIHSDVDTAQQILECVVGYLPSIGEDITKNIAEHSLGLINNTSYSYINLDLIDKQKEQNDVSEKKFMIEKIKERPVNKKKLLRRTLITASMAVIFGLVACFTFLVLEPVISNWLYPEEEPQVVVFPEDQDEMSPEQMLAENMQRENQSSQSSSAPSEVMEQEQIRELLSGIILNLDNYKQIYSALAQYVAEMNRSMVTVTGVSSGVDWFNNVNESKNQSSGVIIAQNGKQLLILTDYSPVKQADDIIVTFNEGTQADASLKEKDETIGLAVIAVELDTLNEDFLKNDITIATFGSSNIKDIAGLPVVALGRPMGTNGSLGYGIITSSASESAASDTTYRILQTNIVGSQNAGGVLFNLQGQVIGIITNGKSATDMKNMVCAYGITELKRHIEKMSNGEKFAYLGLKGVGVTEEANSELGVPYGAYITEVEMDSPAMLAGIQQGDVITGFGERVIVSFDEYTNSLLSMKPGDSVELTIMRQSQQEYKEMKFDITLTVLK